MQKNIIAKIQKLFSLANSANENEAKAAMNMANTLLLKYNLSLQQVEGYIVNYETRDIKKGVPTLKIHQKLIIDILQKYFFVKCMVHSKPVDKNYHRVKYLKTVQIIGTKENCDIASYIFVYLDRVYPELWNVYSKDNFNVKHYRKSYYYGLSEGIKSMLEATKWRVQEEVGLVLKEDANLAKLIDQKCKGKYGSSSNFEVDSKVYDDGISDGSSITLRRPIKSDCSDKEGKRLY